MKFKLTIAVALLGMLLLAGCNGRPSTEELAKEVQAHIEETWAEQPDLASARITSFDLTHKGGNQYRGILEARQYGESVTLGVDVTYDGDSFMWEIR